MKLKPLKDQKRSMANRYKDRSSSGRYSGGSPSSSNNFQGMKNTSSNLIEGVGRSLNNMFVNANNNINPGPSIQSGGFAGPMGNRRVTKDTNAPQDPLGPGGPGAGDVGHGHGGGAEDPGGIWNTADPDIIYTPDYYNPFIGGKAQNQPGIDPGQTVNPPVYQEPGEPGPNYNDSSLGDPHWWGPGGVLDPPSGGMQEWDKFEGQGPVPPDAGPGEQVPGYNYPPTGDQSFNQEYRKDLRCAPGDPFCY